MADFQISNDEASTVDGVTVTGHEIRAVTDGSLKKLPDAVISDSYHASKAELLTLLRSGGMRGGWSWFSDPRAITIGDHVLTGGSSSKLGIVKTTVAGGSADAQAMIFDNKNGDDHLVPTWLKRQSDNKILCFLPGPTFDGIFASDIQIFTSTNANDDSAFGSGVAMSLGRSECAYPCPVQLTGETDSPIYLFLRCKTDPDERTLHYVKSTDNGATWGTPVRVLTGFRPYANIVQNGTTRIDIICGDTNPNNGNNSTYHFYMEGGAFYKSDGTSLGSPPYTPASHLTRVWDGTTTKSWTHNVEITSGAPVMVYATFTSTTNHRYRRAKWNGSSWDDEEICAAGSYLFSDEPYYSGGICLDPDNTDIAYCSRQVDSGGSISTSGVHQLFKATRVGAGNWTLEQLTTGNYVSIRPYVARGSRVLCYSWGGYVNFETHSLFLKYIEL